MLEWLNIGWKYGTWGFTGLNANPLLDQKWTGVWQWWTPIKDQADVWNTADLTPKMGNFSQSWADSLYGGGSWYFSTTGNYLDRRIEDLKRNETMPEIDNNRGFWDFEVSEPEQQPEQKQELPVKMSLSEFWQYIKNKYPQYENISDEELWQKMLEKYPEYSNVIEWPREIWPREFTVDKWTQDVYESMWTDWKMDFALRWGMATAWFFGWAIERLRRGWGWLVEKAAIATAEKLKGTKLDKWINDAAVKVFWEEEVEAFKNMSDDELRVFDTTVSQDLLTLWEGWFYAWLWLVAPVAMTAISFGSQAPVADKVFEWLGSTIWWWGRQIVNFIPQFSEFKETLPSEEDKAAFDQFVWDMATVWIAWLKGKLSKWKVAEPVKAKKWVDIWTDWGWWGGWWRDVANIITDAANPVEIVRWFDRFVREFPADAARWFNQTREWFNRNIFSKKWKAEGTVTAKGVQKQPFINRIWDSYQERMKWLSKAQETAIENNPYIKEIWTEAIQKVESWKAPHNLAEVREPYLEKLVKEIDEILDVKKEQISEGWEVYAELRKDPTPIETNTLINDINWILKDTTYDASSFLKMVDEWNLNWTRKILEGQWTKAQIHDVRKWIDKLMRQAEHDKSSWKYDTLKKIRDLLDQKLKEDPNRAEIDKRYKQTLEEIAEIEENITYREQRKRWQFKDNVQNILVNINKPAKAQLKARLAEYMPDLAARVEAIEMLPALLKAYTKVPKTWLSQMLTKWVWAVAWASIAWFPWAIAGWLLWEGVDIVMSNKRKNSIIKAIENQSPEALKRLETINEKITEGKKLDVKQMQELKDLANKIKDESKWDVEFSSVIDRAVDWLETKAWVETPTEWLGNLWKTTKAETNKVYQGWEWTIRKSADGKLWEGYYFWWEKQAWEFGNIVSEVSLKDKNYKFYEPKDTQTYQVEASKHWWKTEFNNYLKEQWYDWIKAMNKAFGEPEYLLFEKPAEWLSNLWKIEKQSTPKLKSLQELQEAANLVKQEQINKNRVSIVRDYFNKNWTNLVKEIKEGWWATFSLNEMRDMWWQPYIALSPYPNRSHILNIKNFKSANLYEYILQNSDKLLEPWHTLGVWIDWNAVYLDTTIVVPKKHINKAIELWTKYNQKAIFDLETFQEIPTHWDWQPIRINEAEVLRDIKWMFDEAPKPKNEWLSNLGKTTKPKKSVLSEQLQSKYDKTPKTEQWLLEFAKKNTKELLDQYMQDVEGWNVADWMKQYINTDEFRYLINDNWKIPASVNHEAASFLSKEYQKRVEAWLPEGDVKWLVISWWPWSWKWSVFGEWLLKSKDYHIIFDKTKWNKEIAQMISKWYDVTYAYVDRQINSALDWVLKRAISQNVDKWLWKWRTVPQSIVIKNHLESRGLLSEIVNSKDIDVKILNNKWLPWEQFFEDVGNFRKVANEANIDIKNVDVKWFVNKAKQALDSKKITKKQYQNLISSLIPVTVIWILLMED